MDSATAAVHDIVANADERAITYVIAAPQGRVALRSRRCSISIRRVSCRLSPAKPVEDSRLATARRATRLATNPSD